jgi:hypothetical protein
MEALDVDLSAILCNLQDRVACTTSIKFLPLSLTRLSFYLIHSSSSLRILAAGESLYKRLLSLWHSIVHFPQQYGYVYHLYIVQPPVWHLPSTAYEKDFNNNSVHYPPRISSCTSVHHDAAPFDVLIVRPFDIVNPAISAQNDELELKFHLKKSNLLGIVLRRCYLESQEPGQVDCL